MNDRICIEVIKDAVEVIGEYYNNIALHSSCMNHVASTDGVVALELSRAFSALADAIRAQSDIMEFANNMIIEESEATEGEGMSNGKREEAVAPAEGDGIRNGVSTLIDVAHSASRRAGWYSNLDGTPKERNIAEMLCLIHSEISEAMEGHRKGLMDDKLPHRKMLEVELADAIIRIADLAGYLGLDLSGAIVEKMEYNAQRPDHKLENRAKEGGKSF